MRVEHPAVDRVPMGLDLVQEAIAFGMLQREFTLQRATLACATILRDVRSGVDAVGQLLPIELQP
jgi:hypothetical protein